MCLFDNSASMYERHMLVLNCMFDMSLVRLYMSFSIQTLHFYIVTYIQVHSLGNCLEDIKAPFKDTLAAQN